MVVNGRYFINNPEQGYYEVSKSYYEQYHENFKKFMDAFIKPNKDLIKGKIIITSTTTDDSQNFEFRKLWIDDKSKV